MPIRGAPGTTVLKSAEMLEDQEETAVLTLIDQTVPLMAAHGVGRIKSVHKNITNYKHSI